MDPLTIKKIEKISKVGDDSCLDKKGTSKTNRKEPSNATNLG